MTITYSLIKSYCGGEKEAGNPLGGEGVCTDYLKALKPSLRIIKAQKIAAVLKKSTLVLPDDLSGPILMIGVGSGLAPFRGFIQEGNHAVSQGVKLNNWCLFFGCRNKETDYIYREELERAQGRDGCLTNLIVAYSRAGPEKIYVQNLIEENSQIVWSIVRHPKSRVFICGLDLSIKIYCNGEKFEDRDPTGCCKGVQGGKWAEIRIWVYAETHTK